MKTKPNTKPSLIAKIICTIFVAFCVFLFIGCLSTLTDDHLAQNVTLGLAVAMGLFTGFAVWTVADEL